MKKQDTLKGVEEGRKGNQISIIKMQKCGRLGFWKEVACLRKVE
jgi:hypothetical protein